MSDAQQITLLVDGEETKVTTGTTGAELFFERRDVVVARVNGELKDLDQPLPEGATVEAVTIDSPDGLNVLRHSTAHVMAQAVQQLRPDAKLGIGPLHHRRLLLRLRRRGAVHPGGPEDQLEKMMQKIINQNQKFVRRVVTEDEARESHEGRAVQARADRARRTTPPTPAKASTSRSAPASITIYDNVDRKSGGQRLVRPVPRPAPAQHQADLQRLRPDPRPRPPTGGATRRTSSCSASTAPPGPPRTRSRPTRSASPRPSAATTASSAPSWTCSPSRTSSAPGLPVFHPKGGIIRKAMEDYSRQRHVEAGYEFVYTPHITKGHLYEVSGHLDWYGTACSRRCTSTRN